MSTLNKIIANVTRSQAQISTATFYQDERIITIDTSNNRLGINTLNPQFSIDVSNGKNNSHNSITDSTIRSYNLLVTNSASFEQHMYSLSSEIIELSCGTLNVNTIQLNIIKPDEFICGNTNISGENIATSNLICNKLTATDISVNNNLDVEDLNLNGTFTIPQGASVDCSGNFKIGTEGRFDCSSSNVNFETATIGTVTYTNLTKAGTDATDFSKIKVTDISVIGVLDINSLSFRGDLDCSQININNINSTTGDISFLNANTLNTDNLNLQSNIAQNIIVQQLLDCSLATYGIILPKYVQTNPSQTNNFNRQGQLLFDTNQDIIKLNNNIHFNLVARQRWANLKINDDFIGNRVQDISYITESSGSIILNTNNLIDLSENKFVPLTFDGSSNYYSQPDFDISDSNQILLNDTDLSSVYSVDATISLQYINQYSGDVEITDYTFFMEIGNDGRNLPSARNQIFAIDNSFNYSTSHISWIGRANFFTPLSFKISSSKRVEQLRIESFNAVIKKVE